MGYLGLDYPSSLCPPGKAADSWSAKSVVTHGWHLAWWVSSYACPGYSLSLCLWKCPHLFFFAMSLLIPVPRVPSMSSCCVTIAMQLMTLSPFRENCKNISLNNNQMCWCIQGNLSLPPAPAFKNASVCYWDAPCVLSFGLTWCKYLTLSFARRQSRCIMVMGP